MAINNMELPEVAPPTFIHGGFMVPEDQMLAIGAIICHAESVCEVFDEGCQRSAEDFIDEAASTVYDLRKALRELKALKDGK